MPLCSTRLAIGLVAISGFLALLISQSLMYMDGIEANQRLTASVHQLHSVEADLQACSKQVAIANVDLGKANEELQRHRRDLEESESALKAALERSKNEAKLQSELAKLRDNLADSQSRVAELEKVLIDKEADLKGERDKLMAFVVRTKDDSLTAKQHYDALQAERDQLKKRLLACAPAAAAASPMPVNSTSEALAHLTHLDKKVRKHIAENIAPKYGVLNLDQCRVGVHAFTNLNTYIEMVSLPSALKSEAVCLFQVDHRKPFQFDSDPAKENKTRLENYEDGEHVPYPTMAFWINYMYAARYGFPFNVYVDQMWEWNWRQWGRPQRTVQWRKIPAILQHLQKNPQCQFVVYMDSDVYMRKPAHELLELIEEKMLKVPQDATKPLFLVSEDQKGEHIPENTGNLNTGVVVVRNDPDSFKILEEWYNIPENHREREADKMSWPYDQASFNAIIATKYSNRIAVVPLTTLNSPKGEISRHLWGGMSSAQVTLWMRLGMLSNVIKGMVSEIIQPCVDAVTVLPDEEISIDFLHGKWPRES